ncbi:YciI family protein [Asanoa iriomotensis]|uniref:Transcription initiation protein n=1 Tax=Asanoa iriomotensis TaxID=234613 RepID=A0ABQ4C3U7_9ACTN|nr:YciI family protein [Asanoa iriomotensis]GIF57448.1 transcription initiation protein [Asanoa iriomotensis]
MARYLLILRGTDQTRQTMVQTPLDEMLASVGRVNREMIRAGVMVAAEVLGDPADGAVVDLGGGTRVVTDGPYGKTPELFEGFWMLDVSSRDEAVEWARRLPSIPGAKCEIRRVSTTGELHFGPKFSDPGQK